MAESLPIPEAALQDPKAVNMATIWIANQNMHCNLKIGVYEGRPDVTETHAWGVILANVVRVAADAIIADGASTEPRENLINQIWTSFHEELSKPPEA